MYIEEVTEGDIFPQLEMGEITRVQLVKYAGASGDFNPLHTVEEIGEKAGTGIIAHGMLIMGMVSQGVTTWISRKSIKKLNVRFRNMTFPGESIVISGKVLETKANNMIVGEVQATNEAGEIKVAGYFEGELPSKDENKS